MKKYKVAILGATGAVGQEMIKILEERNFPIQELRLRASPKSAGRLMKFKGEQIPIQAADKQAFDGCDIVLGAAENDIAKKYAQDIVQAQAVFIDNSSAFRLNKNVPLVIPEVNPQDVFQHQGIIANPNCSTIIALTAVHSIHRFSPIKKMIVSTYQAVSGAGVNGIDELEKQNKAILEHTPIVPQTFPYQIAYNLIPQIGDFYENGYTSEEMKMQNEGRRILHAEDLLVSCTCVRVPILRSHSISIMLETESPLELSAVKNGIQHASGCKYMDDPENKIYPMPLDTTNQDLVYVGRIRKDLTNDHGIVLWCCGDQIRKGAATNAVQIAEVLIQDHN